MHPLAQGRGNLLPSFEFQFCLFLRSLSLDTLVPLASDFTIHLLRLRLLVEWFMLF
jgi:hypothetical protein